jgi:hypothetical protein
MDKGSNNDGKGLSLREIAGGKNQHYGSGTRRSWGSAQSCSANNGGSDQKAAGSTIKRGGTKNDFSVVVMRSRFQTRIGESAVVCQGKTWHRMLRTGGLRWTRASELVWCAVNARGSKPEIC